MIGRKKVKLGVFWRQIGQPMVYYPQIAKVTGGVTAAVFFCQLCQSQSSGNSQAWISISVEEMEAKTGLNSSEQDLARRQLKARHLLKERLVSGKSGTLEFWPDLEALEKRLEDNVITPEDSQASRIQVQDKIKTPRTIKKDKYFPVPRQAIAVPVTPNYQFSGPWKSPAELEEFQRTLLEYAKIQGHPNPSGWAFKVIDGMTKGLMSPFWDEFVAGIALGESQKVQRDWEIEPGVPYPAFEEERIQYYVHKGEPLEVAVSKARHDLRNPVMGQDLWAGFLRKCDRIADEALAAKKMGVQNPYLPSSFTERPEITKESVMQKLAAVNPQFSLAESRSEPLNERILAAEEKAVDEKSTVPPLATLQEMCKTAIGRSIVSKKIAAHPEWGYE
ncbi:MAG: hypothetical protein AB4352_25765, partial [Hormoscilla sp.]